MCDYRLYLLQLQFTVTESLIFLCRVIGNNAKHTMYASQLYEE